MSAALPYTLRVFVGTAPGGPRSAAGLRDVFGLFSPTGLDRHSPSDLWVIWPVIPVVLGCGALGWCLKVL